MRNLEFSSQFNSKSQLRKDRRLSEKLKEKVIPYLKYKILKLKEHFGKLSQNDFDWLLDFDFREFVNDNPPIKGVFSPEDELAKIRKLPREQRKEALIDFKDKLNRQRKALATCRIFIERVIEFNHDIPKEKLLRLVERFSSSYGFSDKQNQIINQLIDGYYENRKKVLEIRRQFPDNYDLVEELTGVKLDRQGKIDVSVGPMTIDISVDEHNVERLFEKIGRPIIGFIYGGFASQSVGENPIYYIVIRQDKWFRDDDSAEARLKKHEYEHQKNALFRLVFNHQKAPEYLTGYVNAQDPEIKKTILEDFFSASRSAALEEAKDEITACLYDRTLSQLRQQLSDLFFRQDGGPYDYLQSLRNWEEFKDDPIYQETAKRMLVEEYKEIIQKAVDSFTELVEKGRYSIQEAIALLTDKPLEDWPKTVRRLLNHK